MASAPEPEQPVGRLAGVSAAAIPALMRQSPELAPWLRLYQAVLAHAGDPGWSAAANAMTRRNDLRDDQPLLTGAVILLASSIATRILRRLMLLAGEQDPENGDAFRAASEAAALDAPMLLQAAINQDADALAAAAATLGIEEAALATVAQLAALPLLRACHDALAADISPAWGQGYCPLCGAWPVMAELRGADQTRCLRCGRCGADWTMPDLWCPFCGESDPALLGALFPAGEAQAIRIELCLACRGYIKAVPTARPWQPADVPLADIASVEWDLIALDNGLERPHQLAIALDVRIKGRR